MYFMFLGTLRSSLVKVNSHRTNSSTIHTATQVTGIYYKGVTTRESMLTNMNVRNDYQSNCPYRASILRKLILYQKATSNSSTSKRKFPGFC